MGLVKLMEPYENICGKTSKKSNLVIACRKGSGKKYIYRQGVRNLDTHPVTDAEIQHRTTFAQNAQKVKERMDSHSATYVQDVAAWKALQKTKPSLTFRQYLWSLV